MLPGARSMSWNDAQQPFANSRRRKVSFFLILLGVLLVAACSDGGTTEPVLTAPPTPLAAGTPGTTDPSHLTPPEELQFERGTLAGVEFALRDPTTLAFGPDGRLYVGQLGGGLIALTLDGQTVTGVEVIAQAGRLGHVLGITFNPADPPGPVTLYVSRTILYGGEDGALFPGKITKLVAPSFEPVDVITGLPVSTTDHGTNGIVFDDEGRLYIGQGGTNNGGVAHGGASRPDSPLSGAILVADLSDPAFDGEIRYEPPNAVGPTVEQVAGDVRVYASGFRNPYDLVIHSNGRIYATDNGPNTPGGARSLSCTEEGSTPWAPDELNLILEGQYYGHPNRNRGRFDARQCVYHAADDSSGGVTAPLAALGYSVSANGLVEYTSDAFDGRLQGDLIYVEWRRRRVWRVQLSEDGAQVASISQLVPDKLKQPLDLAVGPDGTIYIAEWGGDRITYYRPMP